MATLKRIAVIPARNEESTIATVVNLTRKYVNEIIVVDDASSDDTPSLARQSGAFVISHPARKGYDRSISDGFELAVVNKADIVVTLDADGQHVPSDIPMLTGPIEKGEADIVVGKRARRARVSETLFAAIARVVLDIEDPLCGFKAYDVNVYKSIGYFDTMSSIGTQLIFSAKRNGYRLAQVEIGLRTRDDLPRFGGRLGSNCRILRALAKILVMLMMKRLPNEVEDSH